MTVPVTHVLMGQHVWMVEMSLLVSVWMAIQGGSVIEVRKNKIIFVLSLFGCGFGLKGCENVCLESESE